MSNAPAQVITFNDSPLGTPPAGFEFARTGAGPVGRWAVVSDDSQDGRRVLEQQSADRTDYRFPLAIYQAFSGRNVEVTMRFKPVTGTVDQAGGIVVRFADPNNYYVARANALEHNVRFYRVLKGRREQLQTAERKVSSGQWHMLMVRAEGDTFIVAFDGEQLFSARDRALPDAGRVALWTKADSITRFGPFDIRPLP